MQFSSKVLLAMLVCLAQLNQIDASFTAIVGYEPDTNVADRANIDLDQEDLESFLGSGPNFSSAKTAYTAGGNSVKSDGNIRTIQDLSVNNCKILNSALPQFEIYNAYWTDKGLTACNFGDELVMSALDELTVGNTGFSFASTTPTTGSDDFRVQAIAKSTVYEIIMMYTMYEIQDAFKDCLNGDFSNNTGSVKALDEAAAFHAGSLEGSTKGGINGLMTTSGNVGKLMYALAEKRCENFGTCTADGSINNSPIEGYSAVNDNIMTLLIDLQSQMDLANGSGGSMTGWTCSDVEPVRDAIFAQMLVPLIQGTLRYLWKTDTAFGAPSNKEMGELWAFSTAILPMLDSVNPTAAEALYERAWNLDRETHNFASMKTMIEQSYSALGISCSDVNQLCDTSVTGSDCVPYSTPYSTAACSDSSSSSGQSNDDEKNQLIGGLVAMSVIIFLFFGGAIIYLHRQNASKHQRLLEFEQGTGLAMHENAMSHRYGESSSVVV